MTKDERIRKSMAAKIRKLQKEIEDHLQFCLGEVLRLPKTERTIEVCDHIRARIKRVTGK